MGINVFRRHTGNIFPSTLIALNFSNESSVFISICLFIYFRLVTLRKFVFFLYISNIIFILLWFILKSRNQPQLQPSILLFRVVSFLSVAKYLAIRLTCMVLLYSISTPPPQEKSPLEPRPLHFLLFHFKLLLNCPTRLLLGVTKRGKVLFTFLPRWSPSSKWGWEVWGWGGVAA